MIAREKMATQNRERSPDIQDILDDVFNSDQEEFDGFSDINDSDNDADASDVEIPNIYDSSDESDGENDEPPVFNLNEWYSDLHEIIVRPFTQPTGPILPDNFDKATATPKDYFDLLFKPEIIPKIVENTNGYARWRCDQNDRRDQVWYDVTSNELNAYLGMNIFMGINQLPSYKDYWSKDQFIGNEGIKSVMPVKRYEKITEYLHVSDRNNENANDKLSKVRPVIDSLKESFQSSYKPSKNVSVDEAMIKWTGRLSYKQYLPAKPIKRGIKVWMQCDADTAYLNEFDIYLGRSTQYSENGLGYDVVSKLTASLANKNHWVFFDNYFSGVQLATDLLAKKIYSCGTVRINRRGFPEDLKKLKLRRGESQVRQQGNLTAAVWQDKKQVAFLSTLSNPLENVDVNRRQGRQNLHLTQPHCAYIYNKKMNGVDRHDQLRTTYPLGRDSKKAWKYIFWFLLNCAIVNSFIMFNLVSERRNSKKRFTHLDFRCELAHELIAGFSGRKRKGRELEELVQNIENYPGHESVKFGCKRRCRMHLSRKERRETYFGCRVCNVHLCRDGCHFQFHSNQ